MGVAFVMFNIGGVAASAGCGETCRMSEDLLSLLPVSGTIATRSLISIVSS